LVYGYNKGLIGKLAQDAQKTGEVKYVGNGENLWPTVHVDDLADAYLLASENGKAGTVYNVSYGPSLKVKEVAEHVAKALGLEGKTAGFPVEQARQRLGLFADALALSQQFDTTKAQTELKWQPKRPNVLEDIKQNTKQLAAAK
jgi:nucleoside-diphosphate-sugar epimerase